jgi:ceroid-lipofuscinosis MFS transporter 7
VGRRPQGFLLGWFASAGSLARMAFPIMSGFISSYQGVDLLFTYLVVILTFAIGFVLWARNTLTFLAS